MKIIDTNKLTLHPSDRNWYYIEDDDYAQLIRATLLMYGADANSGDRGLSFMQEDPDATLAVSSVDLNTKTIGERWEPWKADLMFVSMDKSDCSERYDVMQVCPTNVSIFLKQLEKKR